MSKKNGLSKSTIVCIVIDIIVLIMFLVGGVYSAFVLHDAVNVVMAMVGICIAMVSYCITMFGECLEYINEYLKNKCK